MYQPHLFFLLLFFSLLLIDIILALLAIALGHPAFHPVGPCLILKIFLGGDIWGVPVNTKVKPAKGFFTLTAALELECFSGFIG